MTGNIFKEGKKYTFSDYYEMGNPADEIVSGLGYLFSVREIIFPADTEIDKEPIENLRSPRSQAPASPRSQAPAWERTCREAPASRNLPSAI